jgi:uncharacterized membrane protein YsdA (DUF1294 family)
LKKLVAFTVTAAVWALFIFLITIADRIEGRLPGFAKILFLYLLVVNIAGFIIMVMDKRRAIRKERRIPEKALFRITAAGGGIGTTAAMFIVRHKTKHASFLFVLPAMTIVNFSLLITEAGFLFIS